ncbi:DUF922 domain-containing protein [Sphingomonas sabuli]|uniref:DUF922 domain-containing protein n=1 Tax=Sphingomonas sabuli TaxID=2764186 RepID=A0A7G9L1P1_9SPHN|nr:DUF922 domain-containing protein [Sphingomonas sabuli]QNM82540.1 DUF922 domain-containing protein [Sphingomonas sabuli]
MLNIVLAAALAALGQDAQPAATPAVAPVATGPALEQIPGVTVNYYDVAGKNDKELRASIDQQRPKNAAGQPITAGTSWIIDASISKQTTDGVCKITSVTPNFKGTAVLPRLTTADKLKPEMLVQWNKYSDGLKTAAAEQLNFVRGRLGDVQTAVGAAACDQAAAALDASLEKLKTQEAAFLAQQAAARTAEEQRLMAEREAAAKAAKEKGENASYDPKSE